LVALLERRTESGDDLVPKKVSIVEIVILLEPIAELKSLTEVVLSGTK
jgi:hypothetical protein